MNLIAVIIIGVMISSAQGGFLEKFCISPKCNEGQARYPVYLINAKMNKLLEGKDLTKDAFQMYMKAAKNVLEELKRPNSGEATLIELLEAFVAIEPISSRLSESSFECTEKNTENLTKMKKLLTNKSGKSHSNGWTKQLPFNFVINKSEVTYFSECLNKIKQNITTEVESLEKRAIQFSGCLDEIKSNTAGEAKSLKKKDPNTIALNCLNSMSKFNFEPSSFFNDPFETIDKRAIQIVKENQFWSIFFQSSGMRILNTPQFTPEQRTKLLFKGCNLVDQNQKLKETFESGIQLLDVAVSAKWESARYYSHPWLDYAICRAARTEFIERGDSDQQKLEAVAKSIVGRLR